MSKARTCGFRFSMIDGIFIVLLVTLFIYVFETAGAYTWIIPMAGGHFFLFCNIFRVRRSYELIWTGIFLANVACWHYLDAFNWLYILAIQIPVSVVAITAEVRSKRYHGIGCRRINKAHIDEWLAGEFY